MVLTQKTVKDLKAKGKPFVEWDDKQRGFGCRVFPSGRKTFVVLYRQAGFQKMATLGQVGDVDVEVARYLAGQEKEKVKAGGDGPLAEKRALKEQARKHALNPTCAELWQRFLDEYVIDRMSIGRMSEKTKRDYTTACNKYLLPVLGKLRVKDVSRADVEKALKGAAKFPVQYNRTRSVASRLFSLAERWELRPQHTNPVRWITKTKETVRGRVLGASEMQRLNDSLLMVKATYPFEAAAIFTATLTGLRISEVLSMEWGNVNMENGTVILPKTKTGQRLVPLVGPVKALLSGLLRVNGNPYVFPATRGNVSCTYRQTRYVFSLACTRADVNGARLHDLRRSYLTLLAGAGFSAFAIRDAAGHASLAMANRYVQASGLSQTAEQGAAMIADLMQKKI